MVVKKIRKRDGRIVDFNQRKITDAIFKAIQAVGSEDGKLAKELSDRVVEIINKRFVKRIPTVEDIQDIVEEVLIENKQTRTAKAYILYREQRTKLRELKNIDSDKLINEYLEQLDWRVKENANMSFSLQGLNNHVASAVSAHYWLHKIYPAEIRKAHLDADFHIHNLQLLAPYCCGWDLYDLLVRGFGGVPGKIESRPPKHFRVALGQVVNFLYTLQGEIAGAVALANFDTLLAPFIAYDKLSYKEVKQCMQEFLYWMNVPTRVGFQTPFSNLTLDLVPSKNLAKEAVIIGGKPQNTTYGEFQEEMDKINQAFAEIMLEGDAKGRVFTFPIPTYNITRDFDWKNGVLEPVWQMTAKYGIPYFANFINSDMKPEDVRSMCLDSKEEILIKNSEKIKRLSIKEVAEDYKAKEFNKEGWAECKKEGNLHVLSLNPKTFKTEWVPVKRFLKVFAKEMIKITTTDGKKATFSTNHPIPIFTKDGLQMKFARDIKKGDYLLSLKKATYNLAKKYQKIDDLILNEDLAKILGYFVADGNYLFENRKGYTHYGHPRGLQFTFKSGDKKNLKAIKSLIKKVFGLIPKEKHDPRYNTYYLYIYDSQLARKLYNAGFKKYGRLPQILFNSPPGVIKSFLAFHFRGDGYEKRKEIHINDLELSRDLVLLYSLIGKPVTYKLRKNSQRIYLQHAKSRTKKGSGRLNTPILAERVPGWMAASTYKVPGLVKSRMVGLDTLEKYNAHTDDSLKIKNGDIYIVRVESVEKKTSRKAKEFYDIELAKNHLFLHSLGQISFNCCRLRLDVSQLQRRGGSLFASNPLTGSIGVVTINMPRIGYLSKTEEEFFERLEGLMDLAKNSLEIKRKTMEHFTETGLYPYSRHYLDGIKARFDKYWVNHFSTIGLNGTNEALINFMGKNIATKEGQKFAQKILDFMRKKLLEYQEETGNLYNLEATPAESTTYVFAKTDKKKYPKIIVANEEAVKKGAAPYYTNSTQLPVGFTDDLFKALTLQDPLQTRYTGGTVFHVFLGERMPSWESTRDLVKKIAKNFHLPYFTLTPTFSVCPEHGYIRGEHLKCPRCGKKTEVYSRVVGYLRPVEQWNRGKQEEFKQRVGFKVN